jgi:transcriptional regulator with XRE-family HTH domain
LRISPGLEWLMAGPADPPGPLAREFTEAVREHMSSRGVSGLALAKRIGISQNYVAKRLRREASFTFNDIENIATALQVTVALLVPGVGAAAAKTPSANGERPIESPGGTLLR